jgi:hypothetical protein
VCVGVCETEEQCVHEYVGVSVHLLSVSLPVAARVCVCVLSQWSCITAQISLALMALFSTLLARVKGQNTGDVTTLSFSQPTTLSSP